MIIRYTVNDGDYTDIIKPFYKCVKFDSSVWLDNESVNYEDEDQLRKACASSRKFEELLKKYLYHKKEVTEEEVKILESLLDEKFTYFLNKIGNKELLHQIEIVTMVTDNSGNGEYIYYFVETDQIVVL